MCSARIGQSKYLHAIVIDEEKLHRMLGGKGGNVNVIGSSKAQQRVCWRPI